MRLGGANSGACRDQGSSSNGVKTKLGHKSSVEEYLDTKAAVSAACKQEAGNSSNFDKFMQMFMHMQAEHNEHARQDAIEVKREATEAHTRQ